MRPKLFFSAFILFSLLLFVLSRSSGQKNEISKKVISLGKTKISIEIAETEDARTKGLTGRSTLAQNQGMLFVFSKKDRYSFWMKDMKFPLDFIWIDGEKVVDISQNVPYPKNSQSPVSILPKTPVDKVLEVNAGVVDSTGIKVGDSVPEL